jgi:hypothetical protein
MKQRKGSKISFPNKNRKLGLNYEVPSDLESAEERKKRESRLRSKISYQRYVRFSYIIAVYSMTFMVVVYE